MRKSKQYPKNKQELNPKSGARGRPVENKIKIKFQFEDGEGKKYNNGEGRIKVCKEGFLTFVVMDEGKWKNIKAKLVFLRITQVPRTVKKTKK